MQRKYRQRGRVSRYKKMYSKHWKQLANTLGLKQLKTLPNMKKLSQRLRRSESVQINADEGKWQWGPIWYMEEQQ